MNQPFENAYWIWDDGAPTPVNAYRIFQKTFDVAQDAELQRIANISADTYYELVVNGQSVAYGPVTSPGRLQSYDSVVLNLLPAQENVITITVHYLGEPTFISHRNRGGLLFEMGEIISDKSWLVAKKTPWLPSPRLSMQQGFAEYQDARLEPVGAFYGDIDSDEWIEAVQVVPAFAEPWAKMQERGIPLVPTEFTWRGYVSLIGYGNCQSDESASVAERLQNEMLCPLTSGGIDQSDESVVIVTPGDKDIWLLFDMGGEVSGRVDLDIESESGDNTGATIDIGYDEALRLGETPSGLRHYNPTHNSSYADKLVLSGGDDSFATFGPRAFRYARLALRGLKSPLIIRSFGVHETTYPTETSGVFTCSDPRLDRIYSIGKRTLELCMEDRFMDCPSRERAQWVADARIEAIGARYLFGDSQLHRQFLRQVALSQYPDGRIDPVGPGEWDALQPHRPIPGFVAIYIESVLDYYIMTGDGGLVNEVIPAVQKALGWLASYGAGEGGLISVAPGWNFTDWAPGLDNGADDLTAPVNLFYLQALRAATKLAELMGDSAAAASNRARAEMVARAFDSLFWNALRGVYVDSVSRDGQSMLASQQVNSLALLAGIGNEARQISVADRLLKDSSLTQIGSPYFGYYLVQALARCGRAQQALNYIRAKWGAMMDAGATTWWETWDGKASRCHGWGIAPSIWLPQQILGVTAYEPGFTTVSIAPIPCDLTWARGIIPIPAGDLLVAWLLKDKRITLDVTVPTGVLLRTVIPCIPKDRILIDGEPATPDQIVKRSSTTAELAILPGSGYRFEVVA